MTLPQFAFDNSYAALPEGFYTRLPPTPVTAPGLIRVNTALAQDLGVDPTALASPDGVAVLAGNAVPDGAAPLAQLYAGHQFGGFSPQLGDGRAILLGEVIDRHGARRDIQLKGSGPTPYSRMGDGRAWLGPVLREYIVSEAMHALGVPTTRALAAVTTGDVVYREAPLPGAVLTRVAASHIRVGTFQVFASRGQTEALEHLFHYTRDRHYPDAETPLDLLEGAMRRHVDLVATWLSLGFVHGVMNTDNATLSGETIDYGPCAFLDTYVPDKVFSSIDQYGRYAFHRQPDMALWNLAQLATALLPLMGPDRDAAIERAEALLHRFADQFRAAWLHKMGAKLGLASATEGDAPLIDGLLSRMAQGQADFTNTFRSLAEGGSTRDQFLDPAAFDQWEGAWRTRLAAEDDPEGRMRRANPALIPRNHRIEAAIDAAVGGDFAPFHRLTEALQTPFDPAAGTDDLRAPPTPDQAVTQTFCGT